MSGCVILGKFKLTITVFIYSSRSIYLFLLSGIFINSWDSRNLDTCNYVHHDILSRKIVKEWYQVKKNWTSTCFQELIRYFCTCICDVHSDHNHHILLLLGCLLVVHMIQWHHHHTWSWTANQTFVEMYVSLWKRQKF